MSDRVLALRQREVVFRAGANRTHRRSVSVSDLVNLPEPSTSRRQPANYLNVESRPNFAVEPILSSTLLSTPGEVPLTEEDTPSFEEERERTRSEFLNVSKKFEELLKDLRKMSYQFPMVTAIQCIPEFTGKPEELEPFKLQVQYFASQIPEGSPVEPLLNVVYTKLRGKALLRLPQIKGTWQEVENNLYFEFAEEKDIGTLIKEIETLSQKQNEGFNSYRHGRR